MDTRQLVIALAGIANFAATTFEQLVSAVDDGEDGEDAPEATGKKRAPRKSRAASADKPTRGRRSRAKAPEPEEEEEEEEEPDDDDASEEPSEDELIAAVRAAQKVLERPDITKVLKTKGKASRATEVSPDRRSAVIEELERLMDEAL